MTNSKLPFACITMPSEATPQTRGECLLILRRRGGMSQADAAQHYKVREAIYRRWELNYGTKTRGPLMDPSKIVLTENEQRFLARRRRGETIRTAASNRGVSHVTQIKHERPPNRI